jgi:DNA-binding CsgD family transcriptional regulator
MIPAHNPKQKEDLYNQHLSEISNVKLTFREMDVIACIVHNRGEKKIASLLDIAYRTVSAHMRNIMTKFNCNSRDYIIDAIEKSGKLQYVRQYYSYLITELAFTKTLQKISMSMNRLVVHYTISPSTLDQETDKVLKQIKQHLGLANVIFAEQSGAKRVCVLSKNQYTTLSADDIVVILDISGDLSMLNGIEYIDFTNYYLGVLELIKRITGKEDINKFIEEFRQEYSSLQNSLNGNHIESKQAKKFRYSRYIIGIIMLAAILIASIVIFTKQSVPPVSQINTELMELVGGFSPDNITTEQDLKRNYSLVKKVQKVVGYFDNKQVQDYFKSNQLMHTELVNCLYILHALATHYTYNENNGIKARELLNMAKDIAEAYVMNHSGRMQIDFSKLTPEEIYIELNIVQDLPEMYTKVIYLLGGTYIYQGDLEDAAGYFDLSKYLGQKLQIFEGYLSIRSGVEVVRRSRIEKDMKNGQHQRAKENLILSIEVLSKIKADKTPYKINYRPGNLNPQTIIPAEDLYNRLFIDEVIIKDYNKLLKIETDPRKKQEYAKTILDKLTSSNSSSGMLKESKKVVNRKAAAIYNTLGNILLRMERDRENFIWFKERIAEELNMKKDADYLDVILQVFELAKLRSRNTEYTKADSYHGIIRAKERILEQRKLTSEEQEQIKKEIEELRIKMDEINSHLRRKNTEEK